MARWTSEDRSWLLAISLIAAWRETGGDSGSKAVERELAKATAKGNVTATEKVMVGLITLGNMFIELYADAVGSSADAVLREAAAIRSHDGPSRQRRGRARLQALRWGHPPGTGAPP
jgi:hypothetical protein